MGLPLVAAAGGRGKVERCSCRTGPWSSKQRAGAALIDAGVQLPWPWLWSGGLVVSREGWGGWVGGWGGVIYLVAAAGGCGAWVHVPPKQGRGRQAALEVWTYCRLRAN